MSDGTRLYSVGDTEHGSFSLQAYLESPAIWPQAKYLAAALQPGEAQGTAPRGSDAVTLTPGSSWEAALLASYRLRKTWARKTRKIFADDTKIYRSFNQVSEVRSFQEDIDALLCWSERWQLTPTTQCSAQNASGGGACWTTASNSAPGLCSDTRKAAFERASKIMTELLRSFFRPGQRSSHQ